MVFEAKTEPNFTPSESNRTERNQQTEKTEPKKLIKPIAQPKKL